LGLDVIALTAVGDDLVGDFVIKFLEDEGVQTQFIPRKPSTRTGLAVLGIEPPDKFPLVFYRENPADIHLSIDDVMATPLQDCRALLLSGTALSRGSCRDATLYAASSAQANSTSVFIDLDLRPDQWTHPRAYGLNVRTIFAAADVIIGTEEEFYAALAPNPETIMAGQPITPPRLEELDDLLMRQRQMQPAMTFVVKRGSKGVTIYNGSVSVDVKGFAVEVVNTVGAGDAFASGLIFGSLQGWEWSRAARFANACGAIVVTRHGCAKAMPTRDDINEFIHHRGETL
jgi:5-dehydro-2-deoxygluconokinase